MRIRPALPIVVLFLLSGPSKESLGAVPHAWLACPKTEADDGFKLNGTLTVGDKAYPAHVSGVYDDSLMSLSVLANLNAMDTGWTLSLVTRPAQGRQPVVANGVSVDATHLPGHPRLRMGGLPAARRRHPGGRDE